MAKFAFIKGETSLIIIVFIQDDTATDGSGLAGLDQNSGIAGSYIKKDSVGVAVAVDEDVAAEGTYQAPSTAAHIRIGKPANSIDGVYELHLHNTQLTVEDYVNINLAGAADMAPLLIEIQLTDFNLNDASPQVTILDIVNNAITAASINAAAFTTAKFAADFLTNALIADNAFAAEQFAADFLTNAKIADNALDTEQFANGALTVAKFAVAYALASECTAARLGELDAANIPADVDTLLARLTAVRAGYLDELAAANMPTDLANIAAQNVAILVDTGAIGAQNIAILVDTAALLVDTAAILVDTGALNAQNVLILADTATLLVRIVGTLLAGNHTAQTGDGFARLGAPAGASVSADNAAILAALPRVVRRNQGLNNFMFIMVSNVDHVTGVAGVVITATRSIDGAAFAPCANAAANIGFGAYDIDLAAADVNGVAIMLRFTGAGVDTRFIEVLTQV